MITASFKSAMDITNLLASRGRSTETVKQYLSLLQRLHKRATGDPNMENLLWLNDVDAVSAALENYKPASRKLYLVPIILLLKRGQHKELLDRYHVLFVDAMHQIAQGKKSSQLADEQTVATTVGKDEIERTRRTLLKDVKERLSPKEPGTLSEKEKSLLMQSLMLNLYTAIVPLHSDLASIPVVRLGETRKDKSTDALVETCINTFVLCRGCRRQHKEGVKVELPRALNNQIAESLRLFPRKFVLSNVTGDEGMSAKVLKRAFSTIFFQDGTILDNRSILRLFNGL
jgi:hypothetical protein